jgi:hypothetical protein
MQAANSGEDRKFFYAGHCRSTPWSPIIFFGSKDGDSGLKALSAGIEGVTLHQGTKHSKGTWAVSFQLVRHSLKKFSLLLQLLKTRYG